MPSVFTFRPFLPPASSAFAMVDLVAGDENATSFPHVHDNLP